MHRGVATGGPAGSPFHEIRVGNFPNQDFARGNVWTLHLNMAFQTEIIIAFDQKLTVHRAVRIVAGRAAVPECFMLEDKRLALFAMTLRAALVQPRHGQPGRGLHYVVTVRIVALHAIHDPFNDGMMLRKSELPMNIQVALETRARILSGIHDETTASSPHAHVLTGGAMTRFTSSDRSEFYVILGETAVGTGGETAGNVRMAIDASRVSHVVSAFNLRWRVDGSLQAAARDQRGGGNGQKPDSAKYP